MASEPITKVRREIEYPTSDGKPMAETQIHRRNMTDLIAVLEERYATDQNVYVSGNMMMYYEEGNKRKHVSPDVFVTLGIPKLPERKYYLTWKEGKGPDVVFELTSKSTKKEDLKKKFELYRDRLFVREYFLFDPEEEYLRPSLQGFRLQTGSYLPIDAIDGRLPSELLRLHLVRQGLDLRLYDPTTRLVLLTPQEQLARTRLILEGSETARRQVETELERLRREVEELRARNSP